jgi:hypothetical protein
MEVRRQVERRAEALDERDRSARPAPHPEVALCAASVVGENRAEKASQHLAREPRVPRTAISERIRKREHPLADGDLGKDPIDEMSGSVRHAPTAARGTEPTPFARKGDEPIVATGVAVYAQKAVSEHAALEIGAHLTLDEPRHGCAR